MDQRFENLIHDLEDKTRDFDERVQNTESLDNCIHFIGLGRWQDKFDNDPLLSRFKSASHKPLENLFTRRYLFKKILEAHKKKLLRYFDKEWALITDENLMQEHYRLLNGSRMDQLYEFEPLATFFVTFFLVGTVIDNVTPSRLGRILLQLSLSAPYVVLAVLRFIPSLSTVLRNNFVRTPAEQHAAQERDALDIYLSTRVHESRVRQFFWHAQNNQEQMLPQSQLEKTVKMSEALHTQTKTLFALTCQQQDNFVDNCFEVAEKGWNHAPRKFMNIGELVPFEGTTDTFENILKQLYLVRLLHDLDYQPDRCAKIQQALIQKLETHLEDTYHALHYNGRELRTQKNLNDLRRDSVAQLRSYQPAGIIAGTSLLLDFLLKSTLRRPDLLSPITVLFGITSIGSLSSLIYLHSRSSAGYKGLFFADRSEQRLKERGAALIKQPQFKTQFLSDTNGNPVETVKSRNGGDEVEALMLKNFWQTLLIGFGLLVYAGMSESKRGLNFWVGFLLMIASVFHYGKNAQLAKDTYNARLKK